MLIPSLLLLLLLLAAGGILTWARMFPPARLAWLLQDANEAIGQRKFDEALALYDRADKLRARVGDTNARATVDFAIEQGRGRCWLLKDRLAEAESHLRRAAELIEQGVQQEQSVVVFLYSDLAATAFGLGKQDAGEAALAKVAKLCAATIEEDTEAVAELLAAAAAGASARNQFDTAFRLSRHAVELLGRTEAWHQGQLAEVQITLAGIHSIVGEYRQARELIEQALAYEADEQLDETARDNAYFYLGQLCLIACELPRAIHCLKKSVEFRQTTLGPDWNTGISRAALAILYRAYGDYEAAERDLREAYRVQSQQLKADDPILIGTTLQLALVLCDLGRFDEAHHLLRVVESIDREVMQASGNCWPVERLVRGIWFLHQLRFDEAVTAVRHSLQLSQAIYDESHIITCDIAGVLGAALTRAGQLEEAERILVHALNIRESKPDASVIDFADLLIQLAELYVATGRFHDAEASAKRAEAKVIGKILPTNLTWARMHEVLSESLSRRGAHAEAIRHIREAESIRHQVQGTHHPALVRLYEIGAKCFSSAGDKETAGEYQRRSTAVRAPLRPGNT